MSKYFLDVVFNRKSIRNFKPGTQVPGIVVDSVLKAALAAPSGYDKRSVSFVVITDANLLKTLLEPAAKETSQPTLYNAALGIVLCADAEYAKGWQFDCTAASQNMLLTVENFDYDAAWIDIFPHDDRIQLAKDKLNLPNGIEPFNIILIGLAAEDEPPKDKYDKTKIHLNGW